MKAILNGGIISPPSFQSHDWMLGPAIKAICALAAGAMAIVGMSGSQPFYMATIAAIVVGASFIFEHGAIATQASRLLNSSGFRMESEDDQVLLDRMGLVVAFSAGVLGVIAGMITLLGFSDLRAVDIAAIVFGLALTFSLRSVKEISTLSSTHLKKGLIEAVTVIQALGGLAIVVLGILAFVGINRLDLTLIALLITAVSQLLSSSARISMIATTTRKTIGEQRIQQL